MVSWRLERQVDQEWFQANRRCGSCRHLCLRYDNLERIFSYMVNIRQISLCEMEIDQSETSNRQLRLLMCVHCLWNSEELLGVSGQD